MIWGWVGFLYVPLAVVIVMIVWALLSGVRESSVLLLAGVVMVIMLYAAIAASNPDRAFGYQYPAVKTGRESGSMSGLPLTTQKTPTRACGFDLFVFISPSRSRCGH
jgi:hypothetical protein